MTFQPIRPYRRNQHLYVAEITSVNPNGYPTTGQIASPMGPRTISRTFELPNSDAAMAAQRRSLGASLGPYDGIHNSCVTYCVGVLCEGGANIPAGARGVIWLKRLLG